jgi:peptidoglycan/xylan/chitin deacetylase (PgdA/CDA1 family)
MSVFTNPANGAAEHAAAYVDAILGLLGNRDPLSILRETPTALRRAIAGLSDDQLRRPERPGKWAIVHVLQHLADSDLIWGWRVRLILAHDRPTITGYDQDLWADRLHYADSNPEESLETFTVLRHGNLKLLERASPADMKRVGVHAERGEESIDRLHRLYAGHDLMHLQQIARIRDAI